MWVIGDWWNWGKHRYGERAELLKSDPDFKSFNFQTCADAGWVANKFETSRRREVLPWSYHIEVAVLPPPKQDIILDAAVHRDLKRDAVRSLAKLAKPEDDDIKSDRT